jgi:2-dehydro-3-deoxyphosphooctonate aldolase (KDO 8-P synthase)
VNIIAGPCQHETLEQSFDIARHCKMIAEKYGYNYYFKASFDKANRTSFSSARGQGIQTSLEDFASLKKEINVKILTDVHETGQVDWIEKHHPDVIDVYQIPAFLCRQTDLIRSVVESGKIINIKKGQFLAPWDVQGIMTKTKGAKNVWITERGTSFGYNRLIVDFSGILYLLDTYGDRLVYDATHSVQEPGGAGFSSGGNRMYVPPMCRAASALGVTNFFIETHPNPDDAPSDGANMVNLLQFESVIKQIYDYSYTNTSKT